MRDIASPCPQVLSSQKLLFSGTSRDTRLQVELLYLVSCWKHLFPKAVCFTCIWRYFEKEYYAQLSWMNKWLKCWKRLCVSFSWLNCFNCWEKKNECSEKSHVTFLFLHFPHCAYLPFLSFPSLKTLHLPFLTLDMPTVALTSHQVVLYALPHLVSPSSPPSPSSKFTPHCCYPFGLPVPLLFPESLPPSSLMSHTSW